MSKLVELARAEALVHRTPIPLPHAALELVCDATSPDGGTDRKGAADPGKVFGGLALMHSYRG